MMLSDSSDTDVQTTLLNTNLKHQLRKTTVQQLFRNKVTPMEK